MSIEAMKQALEALEWGNEPMAKEAITALRTAIAEQEQCEPVAVLQTDNSGRFLDCIYRGAATPADQFLWQEDKRIPRSTSIRLFTHPAPVPAGWQPIETAPKDGTEILVSINFGLHVVCYDDIFSAPWRVFNEVGFNEHVPTHWMPLQAAPKPGEMK